MKTIFFPAIVVLTLLAGCATPPENNSMSPPQLARSDLPYPPNPLSYPSVVYPFEAARARMGGSVEISFYINSEGHVENLQIAKSTNRIFERHTLLAAAKLRFPKTAGGPYSLMVTFESDREMGGIITWEKDGHTRR